MIAIKEMETQTDCKKCPFMATDGADELRSPMMCIALWATKHEIKHCVEGRILDDCPLVEVVTCKNCRSIKVLDKEPYEDAVSREAALAIAGDSCLDLDNYEDTKAFCDEIKELPSVVHTQKMERWIFVDKSHEHARCSECGYGSTDLFDGKVHNYCPNCGSFMMQDEEALEYTDQNAMMSAT